MTTLTAGSSLFEAMGRQPTLDRLLIDVWDGLCAHDVVECPMCRGEMAPEYGAHAFPIAGYCSACGSRLT